MFENLDENELIVFAQNHTNVLDYCELEPYVNGSNETKFKIEFVYSCNQLNKNDRNSLMLNLENNMKPIYEMTWGWDKTAKEKELFSVDSKFLLLKNTDDKIIGWVMFKFDWDDLDEPEHPVLFCYELQIEDSHRRLGLGKLLMFYLIKIQTKFGLWKTMLTCFKCNLNAMTFYKSIGFDIDCNSPSSHGYDECYEILSNKPNLK